MKAPFYYLVKAKLVRQKEGNEFDFEEINKEFENESPIIAREEAFNYYQNLIDILLQHKAKEYISDKEARKELITFIEKGTSTKLQIGEKEIVFTEDSFGNGIGVYFVKDVEVKSILSFIDVGEGALVHGMGNLSDQNMIDDTILFLHEEAEYYDYYNYNTKHKEILVTYCSKNAWLDGCGSSAIETHKILRTPFDWKGYDEPYWWGEPVEAEAEPLQQNIEKIIEQGEGNQVEFKTTLHYKRGETTKIKEDIAKTLCAFLNSNGGILFIGIRDNKIVEGLEFDFSLANGKNPKDYFLLQFDKMFDDLIGLSIKDNTKCYFNEMNGKQIFYITVSPCKTRLIFLKGKEGKELYVRCEASTRQIRDAEEIINYWKEKRFY